MGNKDTRKPGEGESESYGDSTTRLLVTQPEGFAVKVAMKGKVDLPPGDVYELLIHPDNHKIFRGIERVLERRVLHDKHGKQKVLVVHEAKWKFLLFSGKFATHMHVEQDKRAGTVRFSLAKTGMMKDFAGLWSVQPYSQQALDAPDASSGLPQHQQPWWQPKNPLTSFPRFGKQAAGESATLCQLSSPSCPMLSLQAS
ncbi:hypothetical protein WJX84_003160 [Apatococcus fuscideae]|uniref:Uncharacterized protein n=1 Tax=Apatococcus fuscideae TaxID=2026836 RepID=A0AAW1T180_9CHLO